MVRIVLFVTFTCNTSGNPSLNLVAIIITLIVLLLLYWNSRQVYKNYLLSIVESFFFVNLGISYIPASPVLENNVLIAYGYNIAAPTSFDKLLSTRDANGDGRLSASEYKDSFFTGIARFRGNRDGVIERAEWDVVKNAYAGPSRLSAVRLESAADGSIRCEELWSYERSFQGVIPSPLLYRGVLYFVKNGGILTAMDAQTGRMLKQGRLRGAIDPYSSSPVAAEGKIFTASEAGNVSVLKAGGEWETLAVNALEGGVFATPALSGGKIFARTDEWLYCFGRRTAQQR